MIAAHRCGTEVGAGEAVYVVRKKKASASNRYTTSSGNVLFVRGADPVWPHERARSTERGSLAGPAKGRCCHLSLAITAGMVALPGG
jgi:hypothetical protein